MSSTIKRHRQSSSSSSSSTATGAPTGSNAAAKTSGTPKPQLHPAKSFRIVSPTELSPPWGGPGVDGSAERRYPMLCTLPPTCTHRPTPLANTKELESHYATCHAHVCEQKGCGCVFPEARLLELHFTECHDPLAAVKKERGEKIFACHLTTCNRLFMTPKARRLHLIQAHGYPKEYFFAVTNKGVGGLLRKWGEGASMIRREWKPRVKKQGQDVEMEDEGSEESEEGEDESRQSSDDVIVYEKPSAGAEDPGEALAQRMDSLSLVPQSVQFGRGGGKRRTLGWRGRGRTGIMRTRG